MAVTETVVETQNIRGLDIDKAVKGFALQEYVFKSAVTVTSTSGDSIRWYQEASAEVSAVDPMRTSNKASMALPANLEVEWTRQLSYVKEFMAEGTISEMDIASADIDVLARTLLRLTRRIVRDVDSHIITVIQNTSGIGSTASLGWNGAGDAIGDILSGIRLVEIANYGSAGMELWMEPSAKQRLLTWLITTKGASIPSFSSEKVESGVLMELLGLKVRVSNNMSGAMILNPKQAVTYRMLTDTTSRIIEEPGLSRKIRVWERGICTVTDPGAVAVITNVLG